MSHGGAPAVLADLLSSEPDTSPVASLTRERWERDRPLFGVAGKARVRRLEAAWAKLAAG